jgi:hypothetical protein
MVEKKGAKMRIRKGVPDASNRLHPLFVEKDTLLKPICTCYRERASQEQSGMHGKGGREGERE